MAGPRIALIHALPDSVEPANKAFDEQWPEAWKFNLLDDALARDLAAADGKITMEINSRIIDLSRYAMATGANGILYTCSAFGQSIKAAALLAPIPVLRPNEAAVDAALDAGSRVALLATFLPTVGMMKAEVEVRARERNLTPTIEARHVAGALEALQAGRPEEHDALVAKAAADLPPVDALVLAQFSMTRAARAIAPVAGRQVITTPGSAIVKLKSLLATRQAAE
ncbi:MAG TPA: aspartate/glutamate racemase family protein [Alphaproteobacteria bacterium]